MLVVTDESFADVVLAARLPVVVDFWARWCSPCRPLGAALGDLAAEFDGRLLVVSMDVDENPGTARAYRVMAMPTLMFFRDGAVTHSTVGNRPKSALRAALLDQILAPSST
ncbi:thioredoxin family protein [Actinoplanes sp. NPDC051494]|uniref:thioredoxin family protein n=1 Tax=Actinoplanes sp. NPDC051494 TaxID=3363907 RepID=UPI00378BED24